jgi:hypothetical protein
VIEIKTPAVREIPFPAGLLLFANFLERRRLDLWFPRLKIETWGTRFLRTVREKQILRRAQDDKPFIGMPGVFLPG